MSGLAHGTRNLTTTMVEEKKQYIQQRRVSCGFKGDNPYGQLIIDYWFKCGAPALHPKDRVIPIPVFPPMPRERTPQRRNSPVKVAR